MTVAHERVYDVTITDPGPYGDLKEEVGSLVVEYDKKGNATLAMFEPLDDGVANLDMEVVRVVMSGDSIRIEESESGWFAFDVIDGVAVNDGGVYDIGEPAAKVLKPGSRPKKANTGHLRLVGGSSAE